MEVIKELKVEISVKKTRKIRVSEDKSMMIAEIENWEQKREMSKKENLQRGIIIEDDLTWRERERCNRN